MADPNIDSLNATTFKEIYPRHIRDNLFKATPFLRYLRQNNFNEFMGGISMDETFLYGAMNGGAYAIGAPFNIDVVEVLAGLTFVPKFYEGAVAEYMEYIRVINTGPAQIFSRVNAKMKAAVNTLNVIMAIDLWKHGQGSGSNIAANRLIKLNGLAEAINDGTVYSYQGDIFANYGSQARNAVVGTSLNGNVQWFGNIDGTTASLFYDPLNNLYERCSVGDQEPNLIVLTKLGSTAFKNRIQPQQRFAQEQDPLVGVSGFRMNKALVVKDDYAPSAAVASGGFGVNDPKLGDYTTGTITNSLTGTLPGGFPTSSQAATLTVGETCHMLRTEMWHLRLASDPLYQFGFTGFIPAQGNSKVVGHIFAAGNLYCESPRHNGVSYGFSS